MQDFYLKYPTVHHAKRALIALGFTESEGDIYHDEAVIDYVGVVHAPTGRVLKDGDEEYPELKPVDGYHVNIRTWNAGLAEQLGKLKENVHPATPTRVWC